MAGSSIQQFWNAFNSCVIFVLMSKLIQGLETVHFQAINLWSTDQYQLNLIRVESFSADTAAECCSGCLKDDSCRGAAWNDMDKACQLVTFMDLISYVEFTEMDQWTFFVRRDFMCDGKSE